MHSLGWLSQLFFMVPKLFKHLVEFFTFTIFRCCRGGTGLQMNTVTVYDIQNKFIAYSAPVPEVIGVLCEWGGIYLLGGDRKVRLVLHNTFEKL